MPDELPTPEQVEEILTQEPEELSMFETEEEKKIATRLMKVLVPKINAQAEANKAKELEKMIAVIREENKTAIVTELEKIRKANEPLSPEDLQKLVNQEYITFTIDVYERGASVKREFTIREIPVRAEKRLVLAIKKTLGERLKEMASLDWSTTNTMLERIQRLVDMVPGALETLAECTAICLDPFQEEQIGAEWVLDSLTVSKMLAVLKMQAEANRWRDFFSLASQLIPGQMIA